MLAYRRRDCNFYAIWKTIIHANGLRKINQFIKKISKNLRWNFVTELGENTKSISLHIQAIENAT
jgi:hypothetical protein